MPPQQTRRQYLVAAGVTGATGLAGCSEGLTGGESDESDPAETEATATPNGNETTTGGETPWAEWIPADPVTSGASQAFALDIQKARDEFPRDAYEEFSIPRIADQLEVDESDLEYLGGTDAEFGEGVGFVTGQFSESSLRSSLDVSSSETDSYQGYTVTEDLAFGDEAIISQGYRDVLDTRFGETPSLASTDEPWQELLSVVGSAALAGVKTGSFDEESSLSITVPRSGIEVDADDDGGAILTGHLMFDSESRASEALENYEGEIREEAIDEGGEFRSIEQQGRRVVVTAERESFDF